VANLFATIARWLSSRWRWRPPFACRCRLPGLWIPANNPHPANEQVYAVIREQARRSGGDMEFELKDALKKYHRMRSWRRAGIAIMVLGAVTAPWLLGLGRTDMLLCWLGALTLWMTAELEMRLKTMQKQ
jgi:hypothetical protein